MREDTQVVGVMEQHEVDWKKWKQEQPTEEVLLNHDAVIVTILSDQSVVC